MTKLTIFTVTQIHEAIDVTPFAHAYTTREAAVQAVEDDALEKFEGDANTNDGDAPKFPGLEWDDDFCNASSDELELEYIVTETTVQ